MRIVSFLPAATEMVYALGLGDFLVGVSHECDFPPETKKKLVVVRPTLALESMSLKEIDVAVAECIGSGGSLYQIDEDLLKSLKPDLILTQNLCQVCAPSGNELTVALKLLHPKPSVLWMSPHSLSEIFENILELGKVTSQSAAAEVLVKTSNERLRAIANRTKAITTRPRVFCMEWADPVYCSGHWMPEMVELAGGVDDLSRRGTDSVRIHWADVANLAPEVLVFAPCGFNLEKAVEQVPFLEGLPGWFDLPAVRNGRVYAADANSYFARPGPRIVEGTELLAHLIHPEFFEWNGPRDAFRALSSSNTEKFRARTKACPECTENFECKMGGCWCDEFPPVVPSSAPGADCLCPACLAKVAAWQAARGQVIV